MPLGEAFVNESGQRRYRCTECEAEWGHAFQAEQCCVYYCNACGTGHNSEVDMEDCCPYWCENCESQHTNEQDAYSCCSEYFYCAGCGASYDYAEDANSCCGAGVRNPDGSVETGTEYPAEIRDVVPTYTIAVPEIPNRPARTCSIEQELSSGGRVVAQMLHDLEASQFNRVQGYRADANPGWAFVKEDGSLPAGGGEVVYSRFRLSEPESSERLTRVMACIRALKEQEGIVSTTRAAGLHIHIGATTLNGDQVFGPGQMAALYEIFSFSESVLFKLASAGWRGHRGDSYSTRLEKFSKEHLSAGRIAQTSRRHRYFALNFQRLLTAAQGCGCGACISGDWGDCECRVLDNGTIEWRVFNATTKPETLHAWLLLAHSMTAAAFTHQLGTLDPNGFEETDQNPDRDPWILGWILNNCPLTDSEKTVILKLAKRAPGLEIDWPDFERRAVNWSEGEQTTLLEAPPEIEDDADPGPPVGITLEEFENLTQVQADTSRIASPRFAWTNTTTTVDPGWIGINPEGENTSENPPF